MTDATTLKNAITEASRLAEDSAAESERETVHLAAVLDDLAQSIPRRLIEAMAVEVYEEEVTKWNSSRTCTEEPVVTSHKPPLVGFYGDNDGPTRLGTMGNNRGRFGGHALLLTLERKWAAVRYSGSWSQWVGESETFTTKIVATGAKECIEQLALTGDDLPRILEQVEDAIRRYIEGRKTAPETHRRRADKLAALAHLLR